MSDENIMKTEDHKGYTPAFQMAAAVAAFMTAVDSIKTVDLDACDAVLDKVLGRASEAELLSGMLHESEITLAQRVAITAQKRAGKLKRVVKAARELVAATEVGA